LPICGIVAPLTTGIAQAVAQQKTDQAFAKVGEKVDNTLHNPQTSPLPELKNEPSKNEADRHKDAALPAQAQKNLYTIHIRDFTDQSTAQEYVTELKKRGFTDSYFNRLWSSKGIVYAVNAGQYKTFPEALSASKILREQGGQLTRIMPLTPDESNKPQVTD